MSYDIYEQISSMTQKIISDADVLMTKNHLNGAEIDEVLSK